MALTCAPVGKPQDLQPAGVGGARRLGACAVVDLRAQRAGVGVPSVPSLRTWSPPWGGRPAGGRGLPCPRGGAGLRRGARDQTGKCESARAGQTPRPPKTGSGTLLCRHHMRLGPCDHAPRHSAPRTGFPGRTAHISQTWRPARVAALSGRGVGSAHLRHYGNRTVQPPPGPGSRETGEGRGGGQEPLRRCLLQWVPP